MSNLIEIFCDGNEQIGFGHISRSKALARRLESMDIDVRLSGLSEPARKLLPTPKPSNDRAKVVVFDAPAGIDNNLTQARKDGQTSVTLDWFGTTLPDVNIAVYAHSSLKSAHKEYIGFEYIIIRDEIVSLPKPVPSGKYSNVLVCLGGGDLLGNAHHTAEYFSASGFNVTLVQGPFAKSKRSDDRYKVFVNPSNFVELLASSDWAVTNGGGVLFEALCLGKPALVLPQTDAEMVIAQYAQQRTAIIGIGIDEFQSPDIKQFEKISQKGKELVDGKGLDRIVNIITGLL